MKPANDNVQPRGLRRAQAAAYLGISPSHFDKQREAGTIPPPKNLFGVLVWDRKQLDALFDDAEAAAANDNSSYWDNAFATTEAPLH